MSNEMQNLCDMLDGEIERQHNVEAVCLAQHDALCARDVEAIDSRNGALELLARDSDAEANLLEDAVAKLSASLGLSPDSTRLRDLAAHAPEPWKSRLSERRIALRKVVRSNQLLVRRNQLIANKSKKIADSWRETLFANLGESGPAYRGNGNNRPYIQGGPAMIDQRG